MKSRGNGMLKYVGVKCKEVGRRQGRSCTIVWVSSMAGYRNTVRI
jgi:hypothetical protein